MLKGCFNWKRKDLKQEVDGTPVNRDGTLLKNVVAFSAFLVFSTCLKNEKKMIKNLELTATKQKVFLLHTRLENMTVTKWETNILIVMFIA